MLITPQKLRALKPEQITKILMNQVKILYPKGDIGRQIGEDLGIHGKTFFAWKKNHNVPWAVVLLFQEWIAKRSKPVEPPDPLVLAASEMGRAAQVMAEAMQKRAAEAEPAD